MFNRFETSFRPDAPLGQTQSKGMSGFQGDRSLSELMSRFNGASFNSGLYRIMTENIVQTGNAFVARAFPNFVGRIMSFSYDWLGRIFALDSARLEDMSPAVLMFEPGTGEVLEIPCNLRSFHENELVDYGEAALAENFYTKWLANNGTPPKPNQCIGYKQPLYLGGKDVVENLELADLDIYWSLSAQLIQKTRHMLPGTKIGKIELGSV